MKSKIFRKASYRNTSRIKMFIKLTNRNSIIIKFLKRSGLNQENSIWIECNCKLKANQQIYAIGKRVTTKSRVRISFGGPIKFPPAKTARQPSTLC